LDLGIARRQLEYPPGTQAEYSADADLGQSAEAVRVVAAGVHVPPARVPGCAEQSLGRKAYRRDSRAGGRGLAAVGERANVGGELPGGLGWQLLALHSRSRDASRDRAIEIEVGVALSELTGRQI